MMSIEQYQIEIEEEDGYVRKETKDRIIMVETDHYTNTLLCSSQFLKVEKAPTEELVIQKKVTFDIPPAMFSNL